MPSNQSQANPSNSTLAEPLARLFIDDAEAHWAFDLFRDTVKRLRATGAYDPRLAVTLSERSGKLYLRLNFGSWLVLGVRGPGHTPERIDMALLAREVSWDERFTGFTFERKEGEPEVRSYTLPIEVVRPLTSTLQHAYDATLDFIAAKFQTWKKATHWKQHNPELVEAFFDPVRRERLFAAGLTDFELIYERQYTAFGQELVLAEEGADYEVGARETEQEAEMEESMEAIERVLVEPFSQIFLNIEEVNWAFELLVETCTRLGIDDPNDDRCTVALVERYGGLSLHFNFYDWLILAFRPPELAQKRVRLPLLVDRAPFGKSFIEYEFEQDPAEPPIAAYGLPLDQVQNGSNDFQAVYTKTLQHIAQRFETQSPPPRSPHHRPDIAQAIFDPAIRLKLLSEDESALPPDSIENSESINEKPPSPHPQLSIVNNQIPITNPPYPLAQLAADTGLPEAALTRWLRAIERKKQVVLYGPPGTGKTFVAERLARHLIADGDGFTEFVQFHPAYAYEDFMQGLRPQALPGGGLDYPLTPGRFLTFCDQAKTRQGICVLIIDEINRANLARVFGELMVLLEYRDKTIPLAGGGQLSVPQNVRLIGTMNTADRSIALVDHALRRRFAFIALHPNFDILRHYHHQYQTTFPIERLITVLSRLNRRIGDPHFEIGITYFLLPQLRDDIEDIWRMEIEPYLEEFFFDQPDSVDEFRWEQVGGEIVGNDD